MEYLLAKGAQSNVQDKFAMSPLIVAVAAQDDVVRTLTEEGADPLLDYRFGLSAVSAAEKHILERHWDY